VIIPNHSGRSASGLVFIQQLEDLEDFASEKAKENKYKANAQSWKSFKNHPLSLDLLLDITAKILSPDISSRQEVLQTNHYLRPIHMVHKAEASAPGHKSTSAVWKRVYYWVCSRELQTSNLNFTETALKSFNYWV
jgi:hypothetical protein